MKEIRRTNLSGTKDNTSRAAAEYIGTAVEFSNLTDMAPGDTFLIVDGDRIKTKHMYTGISWQLIETYYPDAYVADKYITALGDEANYYVELIPGSRIMRASIIVNVEGKTRIRTYEGYTLSDSGVNVPIFNRQVGAATTDGIVNDDVTPSDLGISRGDILIPAGRGRIATGGQGRSDKFTWIYPGESLLIGIRNDSDRTRDLSISIDIEEIDAP